MKERAPDERSVLFLVAAVQFVNICDFMILAPLGPQLARTIGMAESHLADATAAYTFAAGIAGFFGSMFLDRFGRRAALTVAMIGLSLGTAAGGLATSMTTLVLARMLAGAFGGPATSISLAIIADVVPQERRGKAFGAVMGAFAAASVLGVPLGIALSEMGTWKTPLYAIAATGLVLTAIVRARLPPLRGHLLGHKAPERMRFPVELLRRDVVLASYAMTATVNMGAFILIPNISTYVQNNLGLATAQLKYMYFAGGIVSFFTTRAAGKVVDRFGAVGVGTVGTVIQAAVIYAGFATTATLPWSTHFLGSMYGVFMSFMFANGVRNVAYQALTSRVPRPTERASFMSLQSTVQHLAAGLGASLSARIMSTSLDRKLVGFDVVAYVAVVFALTLPLLLRLVEQRLRGADPFPTPAR